MKKTISKETTDKIFGIEVSMFKLFVAPFFLGLVMLMSLPMLVSPRIAEINSLGSEIDTIVKKTKTVAEKRDYLLSVNQVELENNSAFLQKSVLGEKNAYRLVNVVRGISVRYGYLVRSFLIAPGKLRDDNTKQIEQKKDADLFDRIPISVTLVGPKERYLDLVLTLEKSLPILSLDKFEMRSTGNMAELDLVIAAYYVPEKEEINVVNLSLADLTLTKDESDLIKRITEFMPAEMGSEGGIESGEFVRYQRDNPFTP